MSGKNELSVFEIGQILKEAGNLTTRPLCVYGDSAVPLGSLATTKFNQCIVEALVKQAINPNIPSLYIGDMSLSGLCVGGIRWLGFKPINNSQKYFVSHRDTSKGQTGEFYLKNPEIAEDLFTKLGKITPPAKFINISPCDYLEDEDINALTLIFIGPAENIRNLSSLLYFSGGDFFHGILMPFGPACMTTISFPAGIVENAPKNTAYIGPVDPTPNSSIPPNYLILSIPPHIASMMAADAKDSFLKKRKSIAFPHHDSSA